MFYCFYSYLFCFIYYPYFCIYSYNLLPKSSILTLYLYTILSYSSHIFSLIFLCIMILFLYFYRFSFNPIFYSTNYILLSFICFFNKLLVYYKYLQYYIFYKWDLCIFWSCLLYFLWNFYVSYCYIY